MIFTFTREDFGELLGRFQKEVESGKYTERIPYETWRTLKKKDGLLIHVANSVLYITPLFNLGNHLYFTHIYDNGFGRFFWNNYIKEKETEDMAISNYANKLAADASTTSVASKVDTGSTAYATALESKAAYTDYSYSDSTTTAIDSNHLYVDKYDSIPAIQPCDINSLNPIGIYKPYQWDDVCNTTTNSGLSYTLEEIRTEIEKLKNNINNDTVKENDNMKGFNFDFGPCTNDNIRMSMYGLAVKNTAGTYVSYNPATQEIVDVDIFNFDGGKYMYKMPVAIKDVAVGDVVIHQRKPMFVVSIGDTTLTVIDPVAGERKEIMLTRSPFGFNFATKIVSLFSMGAMGAASAENPFGNMLPLLLLSDGKSKDMDPMMLMMMLNGGGNTNIFNNPMMLYMLTQQNSDINPLVMMALSGGFSQTQPVHNNCCCGNHSDATV